MAEKELVPLGYAEDRSDIRVDYFAPASWNGVATHPDHPGIVGALQEPEDQLHLPPVRIQQDDLEGGQIQSIGQNEVSFLAHIERDQAIDGLIFGIGQPHTLVCDVLEDVAYCVWQGDGQSLHPLVQSWPWLG